MTKALMPRIAEFITSVKYNPKIEFKARAGGLTILVSWCVDNVDYCAYHVISIEHAEKSNVEWSDYLANVFNYKIDSLLGREPVGKT